jgi:transcriptional regulator with XRE-family HTH domain
MKVGEKVRYLRELEGKHRGLNRAMTQQELVRAVRTELKHAISQSYLSQIESGYRPHLTNATRLLLANFFRVQPGYLVDDEPDCLSLPASEMNRVDERFDLWLISGAEQFAHDREVREVLLKLASHSDSRSVLIQMQNELQTHQPCSDQNGMYEKPTKSNSGKNDRQIKPVVLVKQELPNSSKSLTQD